MPISLWRSSTAARNASARSRGDLMNEYRARRAMARGLRYAKILADESISAPILRKRGFNSFGRATIYLSPDKRSSSS